MSTTIDDRPAGAPAKASPGTAWNMLWQVPLAVVLFFVGLAVGGGVASALGLRPPKLAVLPPPHLAALAAIVVVMGIAPIARQLSGRFWARWAASAAFSYMALCVNSVIEAHFFTAMDMGQMTAVTLLAASASMSVGLALCGCCRAPGARLTLFDGAPLRIARRWVGALLAFPLAYFVFGMLAMAVAPWARHLYDTGQLGLRVPPMHVVLLLQLFRGALYIASVLALLRLARGTNRAVALSLGLAWWATVGLFGMVQGVWLPVQLRVLHGVEIGLDSFAYAAVLVRLLRADTPPTD